MARAPSGLGDAGLRIWHQAKDELEGEGLWRESYFPLLERYVRNILRGEEQRKVAEREPTTTGSQGQLVPHPAQKLAREAELDAHRYAESLLLTPAARRKHEKEAQGGDDSEDLGF